MCGIAGIWRADDRALDVERIARASTMIGHRGPDDLGFLGWDLRGDPQTGRDAEVCRGARVALVHRRLSILDLSAAGWQPMADSSGRWHVVFNGEIYNYRELRQALKPGESEFRSTGDTEVLVETWSRRGVAALGDFVGMFAFAALDTVERRLHLVRDFFGIKPLYWAPVAGGFAFASEIPALLALGGLEARADAERLFHYLRFGLTDHGERTMLAGVHQLPAAHHLDFDLASGTAPQPRRYWDIDLDARVDLPFDAAASRLRELFLESVRLHLRSDVRVGTALSGGIDSSAIVMAMRRLEGERLDLHAVSYIADDPQISEERWIDLVADAAGAQVHRTRPEAHDLTADLERLIDIQGEPFGSTSIYAQHRVFAAARAVGLRVMLDGQGADELLGGYRSYLAARIAALLRQGRLDGATRLLSAARGLPGLRGRDVLIALGHLVLPAAVHRFARRLAGRDLSPAWLDSDWFQRRGVGLHSPFPAAKRRDALREALYNTLVTTSLPMLLRFEDRNSMAHSIESRVPFLTPQIARFILALPQSHIVADDGTSKAVFRRAMRGIVPDAILDRRDKIGFATPERRWLGELGRWVDSTLGGDSARRLGALRLDAARAEWRGILDGSRRFDWHVWRWLNAIRWADRFDVRFDA